jgi:hypothetical protein
MRFSFIGLVCSLSMTAATALAASPVPVASVPTHLLQPVSKGAPRSSLVGLGAEPLQLLSPVDLSSPLDRSAEAPQNISVEAVPTPTAVASGLLVLGGLAAVRIFRRLRHA